jgi:hypothetical protein
MLKRRLITIFVAWLMVLALVAPFHVDAQTPADFVILSAFSGACHQHPNLPQCTNRVVGRKNFYSLYPLGGATFPATTSGSCPFSNGSFATTCNGLRVLVLGTATKDLMELVYVSPTQINLIMNFNPRPFGSDSELFEVFVLGLSGGTLSQTFTFDRKLTLPHGDYVNGAFCQRADIYNSSGGYVQYAGNCSPFPRTPDGQNAIAQIYFGGLHSPSTQRFDVYVNDNLLVDNGVAANAGNNGWAVMNVQANWLAGNNTVKVIEDGQTVYFETAILVGQN